MNRAIIKPTPFGPVGVVWSRVGNRIRVVRVLLSRPGLCAEAHLAALYPSARIQSCNDLRSLAKDIRAFLEGEPIDFSLDVADLGSCSQFQQLVLRAEHGIPRGSVSTYQLIAAHLGKPRAARAVGSALASNPFPLLVPCHRAVRSDGDPGGYQGGPEMKRALLELEGVRCDAAGRVARPWFHYGEMRLPRDPDRGSVRR